MCRRGFVSRILTHTLAGDKDVDVQLLLFESFGGFGKGVGEILWKAAKVLQGAEEHKLTRAQSVPR